MPDFLLLDGVMSEHECRRVQSAMDAGIPEPTEVLDEGIIRADDVRRASHVEVPGGVLSLVGACLDAQRDAISVSLGRQLRRREGISLLRYDTGGFYRPHVDRASVSAWPAASRRDVTVVLFLDSSREVDPAGGFTGGILRLLPPGSVPIEIRAKRGRLAAFPADLPHEVTLVTAGRRDTVVDWFS